jgi:putative transposase
LTVGCLKNGSNLSAFEAINDDRESTIGIRQCKYLSKPVVQVHRAIQKRTTGTSTLFNR